jgi:hypothetical protein
MKLKALAVGVAAPTAAVLALGVSAASATPTFTVTGGTSISATATVLSGTTVVKFVDTTAGLTMTCTSLTGSGSVVDGTGLSGTGIAKITNTNFGGCTGAGLSLTVTGPTGTAPWYLNATSGSSSGASGTIGSASVPVNATVSGSGCVLTVTGSVPGSYTNSTKVLAINGGGLTIATANTACNLVGVYAGDAATFQSNLTVTGSPTNPVTITSP